MKYSNEFVDKDIIKGLIEKIKDLELARKIRIMEVCGTHSRAFFEYGLRELLPKNIELISGPGCPVCVTPAYIIDQGIELAREKGVVLCTFGDLLPVPGYSGSLQQEIPCRKALRVIYSPLEAVELATKNPAKEVVFLAAGFESTIPVIALSIKKAVKLKLDNFSILPSLKVMPPVLRLLAKDNSLKIDGFILPGHVSAITGSDHFGFLATNYTLPAVVAGFEAGDLILALYWLTLMIKNKVPVVLNKYSRVVKNEGNLQAQNMIEEFFTSEDVLWRGIGRIKNSGLKLKNEYINFAAGEKFKLESTPEKFPPECSCGEILKGQKKPSECKLFGKECTPFSPVGACMVSSEGSCATYYHFKRR